MCISWHKWDFSIHGVHLSKVTHLDAVCQNKNRLESLDNCIEDLQGGSQC